MIQPSPNKKKWWVLIPLLVVSAWLAVFGDKTPTSTATAPAATSSNRNASAPPAIAPPQRIPATTVSQATSSVAHLILREQLIPISPTTTGANPKASADLFSGISWTPIPKRVAPPPPLPPPAPVAPALPFAYIGKQKSGEAWQVFLTRGEQTLVVTAGSVIDGVYRVESVTPPSLEITYLPLGERQSISIGEAQ